MSRRTPVYRDRRMSAVMARLGGLGDDVDMGFGDDAANIAASVPSSSGDVFSTDAETQAILSAGSAPQLSDEQANAALAADYANGNVQVFAAQTPPTNPTMFGLDPSKLVQTAQGVYKYVSTLDKTTGKTVFTPVQVADKNGNAIAQPSSLASIASSPVGIGVGVALLFAMLKG